MGRIDQAHGDRDLAADPGLLNRDPFGAGWLFVMRVAGGLELLAAAYDALVAGGA